MKELLSIGELANATGTKVVTVRYYEQIGLLPAPARTQGNYRAFTADHVRWLRFIRRCRDLGFTLEQIRGLLRLSTQENKECVEVDRITAGHLQEIEKKIADLKRLAVELRRLSACCRGDGLIADCRIIEALSPDEHPVSAAPGRTRKAQRMSAPSANSRCSSRDDDLPSRYGSSGPTTVHNMSAPTVPRAR